MISWYEYKENLEKEEEKTGLDIDHDKERGEPKEHQEKFKKKHKEMLEFFKKRKDGAAKVAREAHEKGGASILTYWHFKAKDKPYQEVLKAIEEGRNESFFMNKCKSALSKLHPNKMSQESFQKIIGEAEVWGEAVAQIFSK